MKGRLILNVHISFWVCSGNNAGHLRQINNIYNASKLMNKVFMLKKNLKFIIYCKGYTINLMLNNAVNNPK